MKDMRLEELPVSQLGQRDRQAWSQLRGNQPGMDSPLLSWTLLETVDRIRGDVCMGIARDDSGPVLMAPYHRHGAVAKPFAGPLSDLQAAARRADVSVDGERLLKGWGLSSLLFNAHLVHDEQDAFQAGYCVHDESPYIDVSLGFEAYREGRRRAKSDELKESLRKARKIQRELGELKFVPQSRSAGDLEQILAWKSEQLRARNAFDTMRVDWVRHVLQAVAASDEPDCRGMVCCLRVAGELVAGAIAVRNETVMHGWVLAFNPQARLRRYSPGILLLTQLIQAAPDLGIQRIDMGRGGESYKNSFKSGAFPVVEGVLDVQRWRARLRRRLLGCREWLAPSVRDRLQSVLNRWRYEAEAKSANEEQGKATADVADRSWT